MASESVTWLLPFMVLDFALLFACILAIGTVYGIVKGKPGVSLVRDALIIAIVIGSARYGISTGRSVAGLLGMGVGTCLSVMLHSKEFSETNDMAPYGYVTAFSIISSLLVFSGILTSELR